MMTKTRLDSSTALWVLQALWVHFQKIGTLLMFAAYVLATSSGWQAGGSGWTDGPSFSWKQGTQQTPVILNDRSGTSWINPEVPSAVASGGPSDWQTATSITRINTPVGYAAPAPSAGGGGWKTPIISHASPATYSGSWQGPSAPIKVAAVPQQSSSGYSAAWIAPAAPQPIPVAITYGGGGRVWQAPAPASASWTSVPAVTKGAGWPMGSRGRAMGLGNTGGAWRVPGGPAINNPWMAMAGGGD